MSEPKPEPGRPRKWSSDAEWMRAKREAKRQENEVAVAKSTRKKLAEAARIVVPAPTDPQHRQDTPPGIGDKIELDLARKQIEALRKEIRSREDEYDTLYGWYRERGDGADPSTRAPLRRRSRWPLLGRSPQRRWDAAGGLVSAKAELPGLLRRSTSTIAIARRHVRRHTGGFIMMTRPTCLHSHLASDGFVPDPGSGVP